MAPAIETLTEAEFEALGPSERIDSTYRNDAEIAQALYDFGLITASEQRVIGFNNQSFNLLPGRSAVVLRHIWTLVEHDSGENAAAGFHHVNRQGYIVTKEPAPEGVFDAVYFDDADLDYDDVDDDEYPSSPDVGSSSPQP